MFVTKIYVFNFECEYQYFSRILTTHNEMGNICCMRISIKQTRFQFGKDTWNKTMLLLENVRLGAHTTDEYAKYTKKRDKQKATKENTISHRAAHINVL